MESLLVNYLFLLVLRGDGEGGGGVDYRRRRLREVAKWNCRRLIGFGLWR